MSYREWRREYDEIMRDMRIRGRLEGRNGNIEAMQRHIALRPGEVGNQAARERSLYETGLRLHGLPLPGQTGVAGGTDGSQESSQSRIEEERRRRRREEERRRRRREALIISGLEEQRRIQAEEQRRREEEDAEQRVSIINNDVEVEPYIVTGRVVGPGDEYTDYEVGRVVDMDGGKRKKNTRKRSNKRVRKKNTRKRSNKRKNTKKRSNKRVRRK